MMAYQRCLTRHQSLVRDIGALEEMQTAVEMKAAREMETTVASKTTVEMETALRWVAALVIGSLALRVLFVFLFRGFLSH